MLDAALVDRFRPGVSLIVGTASTSGEPRATRAWSFVVVDVEADRVRVVVTADDPVAVANLAVGALVSVTAADVRTLQAAQVKGRVERVEEVSEADLAAMVHETDAFIEAVNETDGLPPDVIRRMLPNAVLAIELAVGDRFEQSPGPGAGARLAVS